MKKLTIALIAAIVLSLGTLADAKPAHAPTIDGLKYRIADQRLTIRSQSDAIAKLTQDLAESQGRVREEADRLFLICNQDPRPQGCPSDSSH